MAKRRYNNRAVRDAMSLKRTNPAAWRRLPRALRAEATEAEKLFSKPLPSVQGLIETMERIPSKLLDLAMHDERVGEMNPGELAGYPAAIAEYIKVPGHRGRHQDTETLRRIRVVEKYLEQGLSQGEIARRLGIPYNRLRAFVSNRKLVTRR